MTNLITITLAILVAISGADPAPPASPLFTKPLSERDAWARPMRSVLGRQRHAPTEDFAGKVLVDILAGDDGWNAFADALDAALATSSLQPVYLDTKGISPLVRAVESRPLLLIVGSTRRFTPDEAIAVANFVSLGGRLLALSYATPAYTARIVDMNVLLNEYAITASLGRAPGATLLEKHAIADGLGPLPALELGIGLWTTSAQAVAKAGTTPWLLALDLAPGRVVALDAKALAAGQPAAPRKPAQPSPFLPLISRVLTWLTAPE